MNKPRELAEAHVRGVVESIMANEPTIAFGERDGPCVVEYRDWTYRNWPARRAFSCLGCKHLTCEPEYSTNFCEHPDFHEAYGCHQSVANNSWMRKDISIIHAFSCPVLRRLGVDAHCPQPNPLEVLQQSRPASNAYRSEAEIFAIPQSVPYYTAEAYERGERVDRQHPTY
ncbi:hypothetical protein OH491_13720 [Termitidicoccus mucosus]|uniref:Uncharacterized protein n=1 Tax=Termitidicoccus mucosus TaxID=1184151 RepID=A0A178IJ57_9BACT|nr:hypothetical protein AW736_13735 [Opitutaceae bacterium TSB47]